METVNTGSTIKILLLYPNINSVLLSSLGVNNYNNIILLIDKIILREVETIQLQSYNKLTAEPGQNCSKSMTHRQILTHSEETNLRNIFPTHFGNRAHGLFPR